jgi:hypothetical protein
MSVSHPNPEIIWSEKITELAYVLSTALREKR